VTNRVVLATHNPGKLREVAEIVQAEGLTSVELVSAGELGVSSPVEDGVTFEQNALIKARNACQATGLPALAEDSGLCVEVLGGAPGVFSALWSGAHGADQANLRLLLAQLVDVPDPHRGAWYQCVAALVAPSGEEAVASGRLAGRLAHAPQGAGGFGYDPIFMPEGMVVTAAQLSPAEKNAISHRGRALRALVPSLAQLG